MSEWFEERPPKTLALLPLLVLVLTLAFGVAATAGLDAGADPHDPTSSIDGGRLARLSAPGSDFGAAAHDGPGSVRFAAPAERLGLGAPSPTPELARPADDAIPDPPDLEPEVQPPSPALPKEVS